MKKLDSWTPPAQAGGAFLCLFATQVILRFLHLTEHRANAFAAVRVGSEPDTHPCCRILRGGFFRGVILGSVACIEA